MSPELVAILLNNQKPKDTERNNNRVLDMICYQCRGIGHRARTCTNTPRPQVVNKLMTRMDIKQYNDCRRYRHPEVTCWNKPKNAHLRPDGWQGPYHYVGFPTAAETGNVSLNHEQTSD